MAFNILDEGQQALPGYQKITVHMIFEIKMDFTRKARFVANGAMTETPSSVTYGLVVSQDSVRIMFTIAALNGLEVIMSDVGNAYLNTKPREKFYFIAGKELEDYQGRAVVIIWAL